MEKRRKTTMKYQTPQLKKVGAASSLIQNKPVPGTDGPGSLVTQQSMAPSLEAGD
jgi:hypothetical protein